MIRAVVFALIASPVAAADFEFCWTGANGYILEGRMSLPDAALSKSTVTQTDVSAFAISGSQDGLPLGSWSLEDLTPNSDWNLNFDPQTMTFATGGLSFTSMGQEWNANGSVTTCGAQGFGFNAGSSGQDLCVDNRYLRDSTIPPHTTLRVYPLGDGPACGTAPLLGGLLILRQQG